MYAVNEIFFPHHIIPSIKDLGGSQWHDLVDRVAKLPQSHEETLAFMRMMIKLNGCMGCETDSYRAMKGCLACTQQTLRRYKGDDNDLLQMFDEALTEIRAYAEDNSHWGIQVAEKVLIPS